MRNLFLLFALSVSISAQVPTGSSQAGASIALGPGTSPPPVFVQTQNVTVTGTAAETTLIGTGFGSPTLPANFFSTPGSFLRVKVAWVWTTTNVAETVNLRLKLGGTLLITYAMTTASGHNLGCYLDYTITDRTTGAPGTLMAQPLTAPVCYDSTSGTTNVGIFPNAASGVGTVSLTTTSTLAFDFTMQITGGTTSSVTVTQVILSGY